MLSVNNMNKKEIEFYLKFHKGFRKRHDLNSALKSNLLLSNENMKKIIFLSIPSIRSPARKSHTLQKKRKTGVDQKTQSNI